MSKMPLYSSVEAESSQIQSSKVKTKVTFQSRFLFQPSTVEWRSLGLRMGERRDEESILIALRYWPCLAVLASLKFSIVCMRNTKPHPGASNDVKVVSPKD